MRAAWRVPFDLLGLGPGEAPPARVALQIAAFDVVQSLGGGYVCSAETFEADGDGDELHPVPGGLYDEDVFGPIPSTRGGGVDLSTCAVEPITRRPQVRRAGEIVLPSPMLHPWLRRHAPGLVQTATGKDTQTIEGLLDGRLALDGGGNVVPVAEHAQAPASGFDLGAAALGRLARAAGSPFEGILRRIPVLPAGLRPASREGSALHYRTPTLLYQRLLMVMADLDDAFEDADATLGDRARAIAAVQRQVDGLFTDGLDDAGRPAAPGEATIPPLAFGVGGSFGARCLPYLAAIDGPDAFILALRGSLFTWRAHVEASCLEILPLNADGSIDEATRETIWTDRAAGAFGQVYEEQLGRTLEGAVMHGPAHAPPHVDVYAFPPREAGAPLVVLTAGASTVPLTAALSHAHADAYIELVMYLPPDLDVPRREGMMRALLALARYPSRRSTFLAGGHDVGIGGPVVPGSALSAWVIFDEEESWIERLADALPRHPRYLLAVAVTAEEQALEVKHGSKALRERLSAAGGLISDPRRG